MGVNTDLLHGYPVIDDITGASSIPKYQTSTFHQKTLNNPEQKFSYTRFKNPTLEVLEKAFAKLEHSKYALAYSSGMGAISNVLMLLKSGQHAIFPKDVYGGTFQFVTSILPSYNIEITFVDMSSIQNIERVIQENTALIYVETPSNPLLKISDIKKIANLAKKNNIMTIADNTFMTSLYQKPLDLGIDIVVESVTKFINGHSDVIAGLVATNDIGLYEKLYLFQKNFGAILGIEDAWLVLRGIKTLGLRLEKSTSNAQKMAEFLNKHPQIYKVYYPGLQEHPGFSKHKTQALNGGSILSFEFKNENILEKFISKIEIPILAVSLGGVESILSHPFSMSHASLSDKEKKEQGIKKTLLRFSCGIEDIEDLLHDFNKALL